MATTKKRVDLSLTENVHILRALGQPECVNALKVIMVLYKVSKFKTHIIAISLP